MIHLFPLINSKNRSVDRTYLQLKHELNKYKIKSSADRALHILRY
jgi:hypothetical protein